MGINFIIFGTIKENENEAKMKEFKFIIKDKIGLHARPAGAISAMAKCFKSEISVSCGEKRADAKRLLSLMSLGATSGTELSFKIEGVDEETAQNAMKEICKEKLG